MDSPQPSFSTVLWRGLRRRCPRCGRGRLFRRWYTLDDRCPFCEYEYEPSDGGTWAFMYVSSPALTGVFFVALFLIQPTDVLIGQAIVLPLALVVLGGTLPFRKGLAVALEYLVDRKCTVNEHDESKEN
ncbi:MAG: DUF983 domain-containing protein [Planctomycetes bacterium]|nr:DUF983 domain-containing protein [Planctomycetota bacterium]